MAREGWPAVVATNLGKRYRVAWRRRRPPRAEDGTAARDSVAPTQEPGNSRGAWVWALRHVDFRVESGEIFGVIGRNGSGKSTLLKLLAGVTAPTAGTAELRGRVAALLQVGAGFHPQLTGRDNIGLSGAIMGLTPGEISAHFDEIVAFSEIGDFLDEPVKRYSSGMNSRLAFSVAAFLPADIMLIDEVLAVGDAAFNLKAKEKMVSQLQDGRSVVYVGHDLNTIRTLCTNALVLDKGRVAFSGSAAETADFYEQEIVAPLRARQAKTDPGRQA